MTPEHMKKLRAKCSDPSWGLNKLIAARSLNEALDAIVALEAELATWESREDTWVDSMDRIMASRDHAWAEVVRLKGGRWTTQEIADFPFHIEVRNVIRLAAKAARVEALASAKRPEDV